MTPRRALLSDVLWSLVAVGILAAGVAGFLTLGALREPIVAAPMERVVPPVDAAPLRRHDGPVPVVAEGFVRPVRELGVATETPGRVVEVHPALRARGRAREGVQAVVGQGALTTGPNGGPGTVGGTFAHVVVKLLDAELRSFPTSDFEAAWRDEIGALAGVKRLTLSSNVVNAGDPIALELSVPDGREIRPVLDEAYGSPNEILRRDGRAITTLTGDVDASTITASEANAWIRDELVPGLVERHPGLIVEFGGEQRTQGDAGAALGKAFAGAMLVIFALLALIFRSWVQPIVVMAAIPLGLIGAVAGHLIEGIPLGLLSIFGIIGLSGVVINNSLVMIDRYNEYLSKGHGTRTAVIEGTKERFRPILLTSVTTFLGIYPLIMETSLQAQFLVPLAVSIGYGVLFGTVIILGAVPALFVAQAKLFRTWVREADEGVGDAGGASGRAPALAT